MRTQCRQGIGLPLGVGPLVRSERTGRRRVVAGGHDCLQGGDDRGRRLGIQFAGDPDASVDLPDAEGPRHPCVCFEGLQTVRIEMRFGASEQLAELVEGQA